MFEEPAPDERFPYPTKPMYFPDGSWVEEFIIPEEDREIVLEQLFPFSPIPKLTDEIYDLHAGKTFIAKDFRVTWEHGINFLVSPYYPESGGTVIDWIGNDAWVNDELEDDGFDDSDFDFTGSDDEELPF